MKPINAILVSLCLLVCFSCKPPAPTARVGPDMMTILFDTNRPNQRITVLDLSDAHFMQIKGSDCTIKNLTAELILANQIKIEEIDGGKRVRVTILDGLRDTIPYYPNVGCHQFDGTSMLTSSTHHLDPAELIRINGKVMSLKEAAKAFPEIPKKKEPYGIPNQGMEPTR